MLPGVLGPGGFIGRTGAEKSARRGFPHDKTSILRHRVSAAARKKKLSGTQGKGKA